MQQEKLNVAFSQF